MLSGRHREPLGQPEVAEPVALLAPFAGDDDSLGAAADLGRFQRVELGIAASAASTGAGASVFARIRPSLEWALNSGTAPPT
jgi:hypothetical protein